MLGTRLWITDGVLASADGERGSKGVSQCKNSGIVNGWLAPATVIHVEDAPMALHLD